MRCCHNLNWGRVWGCPSLTCLEANGSTSSMPSLGDFLTSFEAFLGVVDSGISWASLALICTGLVFFPWLVEGSWAAWSSITRVSGSRLIWLVIHASIYAQLMRRVGKGQQFGHHTPTVYGFSLSRAQNDEGSWMAHSNDHPLCPLPPPHWGYHVASLPMGMWMVMSNTWSVQGCICTIWIRYKLTRS